jgi:hypothetical protein
MYPEMPCPQDPCTLYISSERHNAIQPTPHEMVRVNQPEASPAAELRPESSTHPAALVHHSYLPLAGPTEIKLPFIGPTRPPEDTVLPLPPKKPTKHILAYGRSMFSCSATIIRNLFFLHLILIFFIYNQ